LQKYWGGRRKKMKNASLRAVAFLFLIPLGLLAQSAIPSEGYYAGSYARLSYLVGDVFVQRTSDLGTERAEVNLVLVQGDKLGTGIGQAEVQFGGRNYLRLDNNSKVEFVALPTEGDDTIKLHVLEGSAYLRVGSLAGEKTIEVHTPDASFYILDEGLYRFNVDPNTQTEVLVHSGSLEAAGEEGSVTVRDRESLMASDGRLLGEPGYFQARDDAFDDWNQGRDDLLSQRSATRYLPSDIEEYQEELDENGRWAYEQPYGYVWVPYGVGVDWRPYMYGHWNWYPGCGWTWVSAEPWGWSVYHYGRWHWRFGLGWYWIPQHYWGPAWVHWWWDHDYVGWCPMSWYNRPVVIVGNRFYDRYHDHHFPGDNRAMSVIHRDQLQAREVSRHVLRPGETGHLDRIDLRAEQPAIRPSVGRSSLQSPDARRVFSARPGVRSEAKNYPSGSSVSASRLRSRDAGAPQRGSGALSSADRRSAVPDRTLRNASEPSRGTSSGREVRVYPSQSSVAPVRGEPRAPARDTAGESSRPPRSTGDAASRVGPSRQSDPSAPKAEAPKADSSRSAGQPGKNESSSGARTKASDPVKHHPSASRETSPSSARAPRSSSASRATPEYSSRLTSGGRTSSHSGADRTPAEPSRPSASQAPRYNPRSHSYSRPASPSSSGSSALRYASPSKPGGSSSRSYSVPRSSGPAASRGSYSAPSHPSGASGRPSGAPSSARSSAANSSSPSSSPSSSSSRSSSSSGHSGVRKKG
jgi:hypothetical protein